MSEKKQPIYVGNGKGKFENNLIEISLCITDAEAYISEYNNKKYLRLIVKPKKETDQYGKTHSVEINTWQPNQTATHQQPKTECPSHEEDNNSDLPF